MRQRHGQQRVLAGRDRVHQHVELSLPGTEPCGMSHFQRLLKKAASGALRPSPLPLSARRGRKKG